MKTLLVKWTVTVVASAALSLLAAAGNGVVNRIAKADEPVAVDESAFDACEQTDIIARVPAPYEDGDRMTGGAHVNPRPADCTCPNRCPSRHTGWWQRGPIRRIISAPFRCIHNRRWH